MVRLTAKVPVKVLIAPRVVVPEGAVAALGPTIERLLLPVISAFTARFLPAVVLAALLKVVVVSPKVILKGPEPAEMTVPVEPPTFALMPPTVISDPRVGVDAALLKSAVSLLELFQVLA